MGPIRFWQILHSEEDVVNSKEVWHIFLSRLGASLMTTTMGQQWGSPQRKNPYGVNQILAEPVLSKVRSYRAIKGLKISHLLCVCTLTLKYVRLVPKLLHPFKNIPSTGSSLVVWYTLEPQMAIKYTNYIWFEGIPGKLRCGHLWKCKINLPH